MSRKILGIVGSYRKGGFIDTLVSEALAGAQAGGARTEKVYLIDKHIEFCSNCRSCTQEEGPAPGKCIHADDMPGLIQQCVESDGLVIGAPVNFFNVNAITRRFMERLVCLAYWPWGQGGPRLRIKAGRRRAVLITSTAMPGCMGRILTGARRALKITAETLGAEPAACIFVGLAAQQAKAVPPPRAMAKARNAGRTLAEG